jgi:glycosyltransferase involved in cell wall biosynthesis
MLADSAHPERGAFVRDQVQALRRLGGVELELFEFAPGPGALAGAAATLRRRYGRDRFDVVHAHFGLSAWPARAVPAQVRALTVHGTDVTHPRTRLVTAAALTWIDLPAAVSEPLVELLPSQAARRRARVLPCGVDLERFLPLPRERCRSELQLDPARPYLLFPADPARAAKRHDRALALARACDAELLSLGGIAPARVPLWVNAANAVVVPSEREGFGLAVLEALACDVPVLATPVGIHPEALSGVADTLCAPFELERWRALAAPLLAQPDPRVRGRSSAARFSAQTMAKRVRDAWLDELARSGDGAG